MNKGRLIVFSAPSGCGKGTMLEEILKDADVLQHCLFDPGYVAKKEKDRFKKLKKELGIKK